MYVKEWLLLSRNLWPTDQNARVRAVCCNITSHLKNRHASHLSLMPFLLKEHGNVCMLCTCQCWLHVGLEPCPCRWKIIFSFPLHNHMWLCFFIVPHVAHMWCGFPFPTASVRICFFSFLFLGRGVMPRAIILKLSWQYKSNTYTLTFSTWHSSQVLKIKCTSLTDHRQVWAPIKGEFFGTVC